MGWLWGAQSSNADDPYRKLDPDLKDFLRKETPKSYQPAAPPTTKANPKPDGKEVVPPKSSVAVNESLNQSLFQDGRYARLWKNYRPLKEVEDAGKSDQEKLMDVLDGYKERKHQIGKAALENCADEQLVLQDCYEHGTIAERMVLCRKQKKAYSRCYLMQSRFLKALGYLSRYDRPKEVEEQIQMHADTLYHRMLAQERAVEEAKAAGRPIPDLESLNPDDQTSPTSGNGAEAQYTKARELPHLSPELIRKLRPEAQLELREKLKDMTPAEREVEERSKLGEFEAEQQVVNEVHRLRHSTTEERRKRREEGNATVGDTISGWLGW